jgi:2-keto-3-deoxy-L-rhamnonate aldolase RhmA
MRSRLLLAALASVVLTSPGPAQEKPRQRFNPVIDLLEQKKPVFGVLAPTPGRGGGGGRRGAPPADPAAPPPVAKTQLELAKDAVGYPGADFLFSGSMERGIDGYLPTFTAFMDAMRDAGWVSKTPFPHLVHPIGVKVPSIDGDTGKAVENISRQLNMGVSIMNFVGVDTPEELERGIAAMRFRSKGGTRPDDVGMAPAYWGMTEQQYREKADVWPLNPNGELVAMPIIESREGVSRVREIAQVKGVGALIVGAGTLGGVYSTRTPEGGRGPRDDAAWEAAIQQILAACKEFNLACGYPVNERDVEARLKQGFTVFIIQQWGDGAFRTVDLGRKAGGR